MALFKRGDTYHFKGMLHGVQVRKSTGKALLREAEAVVKSWESTTPVIQGVKLRQATERAFREHWQLNRTGDRDYQNMLAIVDILGDKALPDISAQDVAVIKEALIRRGKQPGTVNRYLASLRTLLNLAYRSWGVLDRVIPFQLFREHPGRIRTITEQEEDLFMRWFYSKALERPVFRVMTGLVPVLLDTGLRLSEALNLTYSRHIDLEQGTVKVFPDQAKSRKPRTVPLTRRALRILKVRRKGGEKPFPVKKGAASRAFTEAKAALGYGADKELCLHACRHTYASKLINRGASLFDVQHLLGHGSTYMTERYSHLDVSRLSLAVKLLEDTK